MRLMRWVPSLNGGRLGAVLLLAAVSAPPARAATWVVPNGPPTLQAAVALAGAGDTIEVQPGTYSGPGNRNVDFGGKDLVVRSQSGAAATVLDCQDSGRAFVFQNGEGNAAVVEGFTITRGRAAQGGGVLCHGAAPTLVDCVVTANRADESGGGVMSRVGAAPRIVRCRFDMNTAFFSGGGIACIDASAEIVECDFTGNEVNLLGGGIYCRNASPSIDRSRFIGNRSNGAGGGQVFYHDSAPTIAGCIVSGNWSNGSAGAVFCDDAAAPTFIDCVVTGNLTSGNGGAIVCVNRSQARILGSTVSGNRAQRGGGLYAENVAGFTLERSILWGNCGDVDDEAHLFDAASHASFACSDVDSSGVGGPGTTSYGADALFVDPRFCSALDCAQAPVAGGDYGLTAASPCLPASSPCAARIGALGEACRTVAVVDIPRHAGYLELSPRPFRDRLHIRYSLDDASPGSARIAIHDLSGRLVRSFRPGSRSGSLEWDGRDDAARSMPCGVYFVHITVAGINRTERVVRIR